MPIFPGTCDVCQKEFKDVLLHKVKKHKIFLCVSCDKWKPMENAITELGGTKPKGRYCHQAMCQECFT
jgi:hypothetical protein